MSRHTRAVERVLGGAVNMTEMLILRAVEEAARNGITTLELAQQCARSVRFVTEGCTILRKAGLIESSACGMNARWCLPQYVETARAHADYLMSLKPGRSEKTQRLMLKQRRLRKAGRTSTRVVLGDYPIQSVVDATQARPLPVTGPRSVFELCMESA